ncbi:MAG: hypothetical protein EOO40_09125 [Deltaproteobacteria bacterium]|nr:MAG: hypothetical protein EOO40_09125 [Deltaproteobacteria bacterium]
MPKESLRTFLQRLQNDREHSPCAFAGGRKAFVDKMRALYAASIAGEQHRGQHNEHQALQQALSSPLGLHPQFVKDLSRSAFYVFAQGPKTLPEQAFEVNAMLAPTWQGALGAQDNVALCAGKLASWLDVICPHALGLLRFDVTAEATQAALAIAYQAVHHAAELGHLTVPLDQKSTEFVLWPDAEDNRVHVVGIAQYGSLMVTPQPAESRHASRVARAPELGCAADDDNIHTPLYPYRMHLHLSIGVRQSLAEPRDIVLHDGNWHTLVPW